MTLEQLKEQHPGLALYEFTAVELPVSLYFRKPTRQDMRRYMSDARRGPEIATANLVRSCLVSPDGAELEAIFEEFPALEMVLVSHLDQLAGGSIQGTVKKV